MLHTDIFSQNIILEKPQMGYYEGLTIVPKVSFHFNKKVKD